MKTKIFLGCIMAASLITVSCSDLLQENPQGKLTPEGYFSTQEELDMSVYSLYSKVNYSQTRTCALPIYSYQSSVSSVAGK